MWRGRLAPFAVTYELQIELAVPREVGYRARAGGMPRITVRSPGLRRRRAEPDKSIPHVYKNEQEPDFPLLCLYDPAQREWTHDLLVAETIIPWSIDWLACYEVWHVDGDWVGGGRHPGACGEARPGGCVTAADRRSLHASPSRRQQLPWPNDRPFRILSIDGGGIRGIFPATVLAHFEKRFLGGRPISGYFDLVTGTSTGGILALGLGSGLTATELADLYTARGGEIFPPPGLVARHLRKFSQFVKHRYNRRALTEILTKKFADRRVRDSKVRLCVPALEGRYGEVNIYKTPHHPDYYIDAAKPMLTVALATSAAPTYFQPLADSGHILVDGGVWTNNPIMIGLVDVLTCFDLARSNVRILSLGCGDEPYAFSESKRAGGGLLAWRDLVFMAMRLQSQNALGQARLLVGPENVCRIDPGDLDPAIELDDWLAAKMRLPGLATTAATDWESRVAPFFDTVAPDWRNNEGLTPAATAA